MASFALAVAIAIILPACSSGLADAPRNSPSQEPNRGASFGTNVELCVAPGPRCQGRRRWSSSPTGVSSGATDFRSPLTDVRRTGHSLSRGSSCRLWLLNTKTRTHQTCAFSAMSTPRPAKNSKRGWTCSTAGHRRGDATATPSSPTALPIPKEPQSSTSTSVSRPNAVAPWELLQMPAVSLLPLYLDRARPIPWRSSPLAQKSPLGYRQIPNDYYSVTFSHDINAGKRRA